MEISGPWKQQRQHQLARVGVLMLMLSLCFTLHAQDKTDDYITTDTENITTSTKVVISAPYSIISRSLGVFTTGIPIEPIYIQAPSGSSNAISDVHTGTICTTGPTRQRTRICPWIEIWNQGKRFASCAGLVAWMTLQCRGGAARITLPSYAANDVLLQTDPTGEWMRANIPQNSEQEVTGLGIKFRQNISVANDALATLMYGKGSGNDVAGWATMTITLNWVARDPRNQATSILATSRRILVWAPTALTNLSTYQLMVVVVCLVGIIGLCCLGCANSFATKYLRAYNVMRERDGRDHQECEQTRVFNPMWIPSPLNTLGYYCIESTANPLIVCQQRLEIKCKILCIISTFNFMDRLLKVKHLRNSNYGWSSYKNSCKLPLLLEDYDSDDGMLQGFQYKHTSR
ncbi:uncharacterized protein [Physcomitrium patens]|uniref:uncharacterized protein isoform X1 n=1 Tax=Physcomitrium patens TaxID=3218 RepID=UPI003CCCA55E